MGCEVFRVEECPLGMDIGAGCGAGEGQGHWSGWNCKGESQFVGRMWFCGGREGTCVRVRVSFVFGEVHLMKS